MSKRVLYSRVWIGSRGKTKNLWIIDTDVESVVDGVTQRFGKKVFAQRPNASTAKAATITAKTSKITTKTTTQTPATATV